MAITRDTRGTGKKIQTEVEYDIHDVFLDEIKIRRRRNGVEATIEALAYEALKAWAEERKKEHAQRLSAEAADIKNNF